MKMTEEERAMLEHEKLRDEFAKAALTGLLASVNPEDYPVTVARLAYQMADVALAERDI